MARWIALALTCCLVACGTPDRSEAPAPPRVAPADVDLRPAPEAPVVAEPPPLETEIAAPVDERRSPAPADTQNGMPVEWLACEHASECTFVHRGCSADHCAPNVIPVAKSHLADARRLHPPRPCPHGPPGHGCRRATPLCREGTCAVRTFRPSVHLDDDLGL